MIVLAAFLGDKKGFADWVFTDARLPQDIAQLIAKLIVTAIIIGLVITPASRWIKREWNHFREMRHRRLVAQEHLASEMDSSTPGGITDLIDELKNLASKIDNQS